MDSFSFELGERIIDRNFGLGTVQGRFLSGSFILYHVRFDKEVNMHYNSGRRHCFRLAAQMKTDQGLTIDELEFVKLLQGQ